MFFRSTSFRPTSFRSRLFVHGIFILCFFRPTSFRPMISKKYQELLVIICIIIEIALFFSIHYFGVQDANFKLLL